MTLIDFYIGQSSHLYSCHQSVANQNMYRPLREDSGAVTTMITNSNKGNSGTQIISEHSKLYQTSAKNSKSKISVFSHNVQLFRSHRITIYYEVLYDLNR